MKATRTSITGAHDVFPLKSKEAAFTAWLAANLSLASALGCGADVAELEAEPPNSETPSPLTTASMIFQSGFESGSLDGFLPQGNAAEIVTSPVASGRYAGEFELTPTMATPDRTEVTLGSAGLFAFGQEYWFGMRYRYGDWAPDSNAEIAPFQIHARTSSYEPECGIGNAATNPFQMSSIDDKIRFMTYLNKEMWRGPIERNRWLSLVVHFKISAGSDGYVEAWKDGMKLGRRDGPNSPAVDRCGQPMRAPYFKMGVYKWDWERIATDSTRRQLFIDDLKVAKGPNAYALVSSGVTSEPPPPAPTGDTTPPTVPSNLSAVAVSSSQINLSWLASTDVVGVVGYKVFQNGTQFATVSGLSFQSKGLSPSTAYSYTVAAYDAAGNTSAQSASAYATTIAGPSSGLVAAYAFDEGSGVTIADASGNQNTGSLKNGTSYEGPATNTFIRLDGLNDYAEVPSSSSLNISGDKITVSAWVNFADTGDDQIFVAKPMSASTHASPFFSYSLHGVYAGASLLRPRFWLTVGGAGKVVASSASIGPGWHFIAGTYDGAQMRIYVDGTQRGSLLVSGAVTSYNTPLRLATNGGFTEDFMGRMDNVRIYARALTQAEVQSDMQAPVR